ncbi:MAG: bifunctional tetrahydrofolate synthase/dihydrofolate synthase [Steroidobacteraceae bacterium]|nr:bifunctional tetrahydrofolate synthase/dihydrofolate synthase [Steroidobacteraceae bacterium]
MRFSTLQGWLDWQQGLHPSAIDLGLDRVRTVLAALAPARPRQVLTVGGTNGKGSVCAMLDAILRAAGYDVGCFTSPHLRRYNERIRIGGGEVEDGALMEAFDRIDRARGETSLTFFEWNALAALLAFERAGVDVAVLEVGLGGRLDAVNAVDADVAAVVSVGLDHMDWLGPTVEHIGREKAGIFRPGRVAVYGSRRTPDSIGETATRIGARLRRLGADFDFVERPDGWDYVSTRARRSDLPLPAIPGAAQLGNAATALAVLEAAEPALLVPDDAVRTGLQRVRLAGRFQVVEGQPEWVLDVAHNPDAARVLREGLLARPVAGLTRAVCGVLGDKDVAGIGAALAGAVDDWCAVRLDGPRALPEAELAGRLEAAVGRSVVQAPSVAAGCATTLARSGPGDRILVFGSFLTVGAALEWLDLPT